MLTRCNSNVIVVAISCDIVKPVHTLHTLRKTAPKTKLMRIDPRNLSENLIDVLAHHSSSSVQFMARRLTLSAFPYM